MYRPFYPEVTCSATQLEQTKVENNAQIEAPRGGEILYSAPLIATSHLYVVFRTAQRVHVNRCFNRLYLFTCNVTLYTMRVLYSWDTIL